MGGGLFFIVLKRKSLDFPEEIWKWLMRGWEQQNYWPFSVWGLGDFICCFSDFNFLPGPWSNSNNDKHCAITVAQPHLEGCVSLDEVLNCCGPFCCGFHTHLCVSIGTISSPGSGLPGLSGGTKCDSLLRILSSLLLSGHLNSSEASGFQSSHEVLGEVRDWN